MPNCPRKIRRRGFSAIEVVLVLFVLIIATFVALQLGIALIVKQAVAHAATVAAREAAKANPADHDELELIIEQVLEGHGISIGPNASFVLEDPEILQPQRGTLPCQPPAEPEIDGDEVRLTLCVSLSSHPMLNILEAYGVDFTGKTFTVSAVATRE